tara:strand:- start:7807 stop:9084 length:1278 start_codon:yes stop_codon:yes gene_type:complete
MIKIKKVEFLCVIGLGYVGLPLALQFQKYFKVVGFDLNKSRISSLKKNIDNTKEVSVKDLKKAKNIKYTSDIFDLKDCNTYIVCVPTPINSKNNPNLNNIKHACKVIGSKLNKNDVVIFESTVYPGVTDEICTPILEKFSNLTHNKEFFTGYSPERVNPGDKFHRIQNTIKVTSGSNNKTAKYVDNLYKKIIKVGTFKASSIKIAEAAKIIENTQRDLNIALVNELSMIFNLMDLDTNEIINAASTKWNFIKFKPGLVGGHCIGVDPYYLTYKAKKIGFNPKVILSGRKINDKMSKYVVQKIHLPLKKLKKPSVRQKILILGITFKENCPDIRNSKVFDIYNSFDELNYIVDIFDPCADKDELLKEYGLKLMSKFPEKKYDSILIAVAHKYFKTMGAKAIKKISKKNTIIFDLKNIYNQKNMLKL